MVDYLGMYYNPKQLEWKNQIENKHNHQNHQKKTTETNVITKMTKTEERCITLILSMLLPLVIIRFQ